MSELETVNINPYKSKSGQFVYGYFKPPRTGKYRFYINAKDSAELYFSTTPRNRIRSSMQRIAYLSSSNAFRNYFYYDRSGSISDYLDLQGSELYYIEVFSYHSTSDGSDNLLISVEVPTGDDPAGTY